MSLTLPDIQTNLSELSRGGVSRREIIFDILKIYGVSINTISKLKTGTLNLSKIPGEFLRKDLVYIKFADDCEDIQRIAFELKQSNGTVRYRPKFIIVLSNTNLAAINVREPDKTLSCKLEDLADNAEFFFELTGHKFDNTMRKESQADRRAALKMIELYNELQKNNIEKAAGENSVQFFHDLNVFFSRLLFCLFAEDTGLFIKNQFHDAINLYTEKNGAGVREFFEKLFSVLNRDNRDNLIKPYKDFPYVNGSIFDTSKHQILIPEFSADARYILLELANSNWAEINPDIFGSIFQSSVDLAKRDERGMDYTSVLNIMKVIRPLFLDELKADLEKIIESDLQTKTKIDRLQKLWSRISKIKIFDPACGSGNFLIITYKRLREIENDIVEELDQLIPGGIVTSFNSQIKLENFYGIEIDDFARELAVLSLYIAAHQMNLQFEKRFNKKLLLIPLQDNPNIVCANAAQIDWQEVCPNVPRKLEKRVEQSVMFDFDEPKQSDLLEDFVEWDEIYLIGNPPYKGSRSQSADQKSDVRDVMASIESYKYLDYIAVWFKKGCDYIKNSKAKLAFVSTNSIAQGDQVGILWPYVFIQDVEIQFAYTSFRWSNSAKDVAGVTVCIISLASRKLINKKTIIYSENFSKTVENITPYLLEGENTVVVKSRENLNGFPEMTKGSTATDGDGLNFRKKEFDKIISHSPDAIKFIKKYTGSKEYINGEERFCLWIEDKDSEEAASIPELKERIEITRRFRENEKNKNVRIMANKPWSFFRKAYKPTNAIIVPVVSSERREYIPLGYVEKDTIISYAAFAIYDAPLWLFALLESKMHMAWVRTVCGKLKTDYRYSSTLGYNTFPVPPLNLEIKLALENSAKEILFARENHTEKTLAQMYDPAKMPDDLRAAHQQNDALVDSMHSTNGFENDEQRLTKLFELYEQMTSKEKK